MNNDCLLDPAAASAVRGAALRGPLGRRSDAELEAHVPRLESLGLFPAGKRARTVRDLLRRSRLSKAGFARRLGVGRQILYRYLDPGHHGLASPEVAERLELLAVEVAAWGGVHPLAARLDVAVRVLLGEYGRGGFKARDRRRAELIRAVAAGPVPGARTPGERALRRYLPPCRRPGRGSRVPPPRIVLAFEVAARRLLRD